jgi:hypothetical protein
MEFLGGSHDASDFTEQTEQDWLQIVKWQRIGRLDLTHVVGKEYGAVGRVQSDYLFARSLWSSRPVQGFASVSLYSKGANPGNKFLDQGRWKINLVASPGAQAYARNSIL